MSSSIEPPRAPRHRCLNAACGCTDLVSAGPCCEWCAANGVEFIEVENGAPLGRCECNHDVCIHNMPADRGFTPVSERGLA